MTVNNHEISPQDEVHLSIPEKTTILVTQVTTIRTVEYELITLNERNEKVVNFFDNPHSKIQSLIQSYKLYSVVEMTVVIGITYIPHSWIDKIHSQVFSSLKGFIFPYLRKLIIYSPLKNPDEMIEELISDLHPRLTTIIIVYMKSGVRVVNQVDYDSDPDEERLKIEQMLKEKPKTEQELKEEEEERRYLAAMALKHLEEGKKAMKEDKKSPSRRRKEERRKNDSLVALEVFEEETLEMNK